MGPTATVVNDEATTDKSAPRWVRRSLWILIAAACVLQAYEIPRRDIDADELEHLHAAFCVWRGDVPYRDFFEHHGPALYYLLLPLFMLCGAQLSVLWIGRLAMWLCSLATLGLTGTLARRWGGDRAGLYAMCLLAWSSVFHVTGIEVRPDVPAALLLILAVGPFTYTTGGGSWRRFLHVGLVVGMATLFTQKSIVPAAGIALAACLARVVSRAPASERVGPILARVVVPIAAGIAAVWGTAGLLFSLAWATREFWYSTWYQLWVWPVRSGRLEYLLPTLAGDLTMWFAGAVECSVLLKNFHSPETRKNQRGVAAVIVAVCIGALAFVKAVYPQYYLLWMPLLAALAGRQVAGLCERLARPGGTLIAIVAGEGLVLWQLFLWRRAFSAGSAGALPHLTGREPSNAALMLALGMALLAVAACAQRKKWEAAVVLLAGLGSGYGALRNIDRSRWSNAAQVAAIGAVNRQVPSDGRVFDGFTGYGALRPHAWYYWWINEYSVALISEEERSVRLLELLEKCPPAAVLFDANVELLPFSVQDWTREHYEPAEPPILWLPRRRPQSCHFNCFRRQATIPAKLRPRRRC
jgi:hypothetical protein